MNQQYSTSVAVAALIGVNALWGMSFPIMKAINEIMAQVISPGQNFDNWPISRQVASSSLMIGSRFVLAIILLGVFLPRLVKNATRWEWHAGFWIGMLFCCGLILQVIGLASIPASRSGFLTSLTAVYTPLLSSIIWRKLPSRNVLIGIALALSGVLVLSGVVPIRLGVRTSTNSDDVPLNWGDVWTTLGALFFSVQVLLVDRFGKMYRSAYFTPGMFLTTIVLAWLAFSMTSPSISPETKMLLMNETTSWWALFRQPVFLGLLMLLAFFCSLLSFSAMNTFQPSINASQASVIYSTEPLFASVWAMFVPGLLALLIPIQYTNEQLTWELIVGGVLISLANIVALWPTRSSPEPETTNE